MFHNAKEFLGWYSMESDCTARVLAALTDEALSKPAAGGHRPIGELAWHIATAPAFMMLQLKREMPQFEWLPPEDLTVASLSETFTDLVVRTKGHAEQLTPEDLQEVHHVFDMLDWPAWQVLSALVVHEIHHRGQLSILMRQAGLTVPSIYGPNKEETEVMMAKMAEKQGG